MEGWQVAQHAEPAGQLRRDAAPLHIVEALVQVAQLQRACGIQFDNGASSRPPGESATRNVRCSCSYSKD